MDMKQFKLDKEPKISSGFSTPNGYFDLFSDTFLAQLASDDKEIQVLSLSKSKKPWYYAIAAVSVMMLAFPIYTKFASYSEEIDSLAFDNYLAYHAVSEEVLVDLLDQEDIDTMATEFNVEDAVIEEALQFNSNLQEYLID